MTAARSLAYEGNGWTILIGDARDGLRSLPEASVDSVVTSPPYWGLRDYAAMAARRIEDDAPLFNAVIQEAGP